MTGLFAHPTGSVRSLPIVRMGNIAMMPGEPVATREFGDIEAYLIEVRSIGGQSGSPAFVRKTVPMDLSGIYLLGLVHGHWDIPPQRIDDAIQPGDDVFASINKGIAIVVPAKKLLEVFNQPQLVELRQQRDEQLRKEKMPTLDEQAAGGAS